MSETKDTPVPVFMVQFFLVSQHARICAKVDWFFYHLEQETDNGILYLWVRQEAAQSMLSSTCKNKLCIKLGRTEFHSGKNALD